MVYLIGTVTLYIDKLENSYPMFIADASLPRRAFMQIKKIQTVR